MHKRTHSRVKPFHSYQCPKTFSVAGDLNNQKETIVEINNSLVISDENFEKSISFYLHWWLFFEKYKFYLLLATLKQPYHLINFDKSRCFVKVKLPFEWTNTNSISFIQKFVLYLGKSPVFYKHKLSYCEQRGGGGGHIENRSL